MNKLFLESIILIIFIFPSEGKAEYQYKTEKKYFDFEFNGQTYQLVGIRDIDYQKEFHTPAVPVVLAVADLEGKLIQNKELISRGLVAADIVGPNNRFEIYSQQLKTQREILHLTLKGELATSTIELLGIVGASRAAAITLKAALTGGTSVWKDITIGTAKSGLKELATDPDNYFKAAAYKILKDSIKTLKEIEIKISELKGKEDYSLTEIEKLDNTAKIAIAEGYASWEMYKEIMGGPGKSIKMALKNGANQLLGDFFSKPDDINGFRTSEQTKEVIKEIITYPGIKGTVKGGLDVSKIFKLYNDSGVLALYHQKYNEQMAIFEIQKSDEIMQNKIERAIQLAKDIGSISKDGLVSAANSNDDLLELSQKISEKRTQRVKGYAYQPITKETGKNKFTEQGYATYQPNVPSGSGFSTDLQENRRFSSVEEDKIPKSQLQLSLNSNSFYNQPLWNQVYELQQTYSNAFLRQEVVTNSVDSYMQSLFQAFQNRDWDKFMAVSETIYRAGYYNRWSSQLPSNFNEMAELGINAYRELRKGYNKEEFNQLFDNEIKQYIDH
ncbi:MAG: hypothetical protein NTX47_06555 [Candidatus Omnitrophica bacterium]|nr:hypothetical protein [Candidatus Omnitrophota bacterium]